MSDHLTNDHRTPRPTSAARRWWVAGVAGLTGMVGLAAAGLAATAGAADTGGRGGLSSAARQLVKDDGPARDDHRRAGEHGGQDPGGGRDRARDHDDHGGKVREVPCHTDKLIQAIILANQDRSGTLKLAKGCTYRLTRSDQDGDGLPVITGRIALKGEKTTIARDAAATERFRILNVGPGGHLKLHGLTVTGGLTAPPAPALATPPSADGAGILVQSGGRADVKDSRVVRNESVGNGGGIANHGTTTVEHTTVDHNTAARFGGGIFNAGLLKVTESRVTYNNAVLGGGGGIANGALDEIEGVTGGTGPTRPLQNGTGIDGGTVLIDKSTVSHNRVVGFGGGLFSLDGEVKIGHTEITGNDASLGGGGIHTRGTQVTLRHVKLTRNTTAQGGGGAAFDQNSRATIENSTVKENRADVLGGGVLVAVGSITTVRDTEVAANQVSNRGGGFYVTGVSTLRLINSKVVFNSAVFEGGGIYTGPGNTVTLDDKTKVSANRPDNCFGVPGCFG